MLNRYSIEKDAMQIKNTCERAPGLFVAGLMVSTMLLCGNAANGTGTGYGHLDAACVSAGLDGIDAKAKFPSNK